MQALVVEDEARQRGALCDALAQWGFDIASASDGAGALLHWRAMQPDIVLLDLGLPDRDGLDVLQDARREGLDTPVLLLTARGTLADRVLGLNLGADDYLIKPCDFSELRARLQALLRRATPHLELTPPASRLGALSWDTAATRFRFRDEELDLSPRERALLGALVARPQQAQTRESLATAVFPRGHVTDGALEVVAHRLRRKIAPCGVALVTLRGLGYLIKATA
jgi:two-component system response regulator TctD